MQDLEFAEVVALIRKEDPRYDRKAYTFVREGLDCTVRELRKKQPARSRASLHVTGPELLEGLRAHALEQYGPLALTVLHAWGVRRCADFGEIVFNLIDYRQLKKTDTDRREDFSEVYDFADAFAKPFLPRAPHRAGPAAAAAAAEPA